MKKSTRVAGLSNRAWEKGYGLVHRSVDGYVLTFHTYDQGGKEVPHYVMIGTSYEQAKAGVEAWEHPQMTNRQ